ncbi:hypothetical protein [Olleya marilimosa]|uniref:hypothetical protein n=1 Tax=Olleya marilimosa TaxID=272164 RepID=UPI0030EB59E2|tara:strand:+ start:917 stop:1609 length:693 start_codon:yes stop_codon:yes gene_type:complete
MINRIKETVEDYLNTENRGNFQPETFNRILHHGVQTLFEELFFEANRMANRQNRGLILGGLENLTDKVRERISHYIVDDNALTYSTDRFDLPSDLRYFDAVFYQEDTLVELCKSQKEFKILKSTNPNTDYPIGVKVGNTLKVLPIQINTDLSMSYLRNPLKAKWTYTVVDDVELFNPSANDFVDVDAHPSLEADLIVHVLKGFGVNLKEQDIQAITQRSEMQNFNEENQI